MPARRRAHQGSAGQMDMSAALLGLDKPTPEISQPPAAGDSVAETTVPLPRRAAQGIPIYSVRLVQTGDLLLPGAERPAVHSPRDVSDLMHQYLADVDREHFVLLLLNTKGRVIGISTISVGDLSSAIVHPREVFKPAILANAASIILSHNHPSGDPTPSPEDVQVTRRLTEAGELLGIDVLDHIVIGEPRRWVSLKERGLMPTP